MGVAWGRVWPAIAVAAAASLLIVPIWAAALPAMPDLPAHLACFYLLGGAVKIPQLAQYFRIDWQFVPNLAAEVAVPPLARIIGLIAATKLFLSAAVALWVLGAAAIQRALFGRIGIAPLMAAFFAYNANFFWGFLNYDFAAGLCLLLFAAWIASSGWPRAPRVLAFTAAVTVVYFCHLFAAAVLLMMIGCFELDRLIQEKALISRRAVARLAGVVLLGVPAAAAFVWLKPAGADGGHLEFNLLSTWEDRLGAAILFHFDQPAYAVLAALAALWGIGLWRGWLRIHPAMRIVLIALGLCIVFMPEWAMGGWGVDLRMPAIFGATAFAAADLHLPQRRQFLLAAGALIGLAFCAAAAAGNWQYYDRQYAEFRAAIKNSPEGTKFMTVLDGDAMGLASDEPYWHMAEFGIIDRHGFTSLLFTTAGQHVVRLQPVLQGIAASNAQQGSPPDVGELGDLAAGQVDGDVDIRDTFPYLMLFQCRYDEAVVIRASGKPSPVPDMLRLRHRGTFFDLYDVKRDDNCSSQ
jgi:hypothetical protein